MFISCHGEDSQTGVFNSGCLPYSSARELPPRNRVRKITDAPPPCQGSVVRRLITFAL